MPQLSWQQAASSSRLAAYEALGAAEEHLSALAEALAEFSRSGREGIDGAVEASDHASADILTEVVRSVDKLLWMTESYLEKGKRSGSAWTRAEWLVGPPP